MEVRIFKLDFDIAQGKKRYSQSNIYANVS